MGSVEGAVVMESNMNAAVAAAAAASAAADVEERNNDESMITNLHLHSIPTLNLDQGDPTVYEAYWKSVGENVKISISASQSLSYFANPNSFCWFLVPKLEQEIKILHSLVGNAVVDGRHIVVGNGSSQLIQAALYALADPLDPPTPITVVSAVPFYSCYPQITDYVRSGLYKWGGDANAYDKDEAYIELVTSPNNPDGEIRGPVVKRANGMLLHDLAYYWPQYTAITAPADHDVMLFTLSKCTGHAGSRIGWAVVKDAEVAKKMVKFIEINTIGVSKEAQLRAASILEMISANGCSGGFFEFGQSVMAERWKKLREALRGSEVLEVPHFPLKYCNYNRDFIGSNPAYAWVKAKPGVQLEKAMNEERIRVRGGTSFGCPSNYVRLSMLGKHEDFDLFLKRLPSIIQLLAV
ncbi:tryptophan aminotransferase-related protein 1-like [Salvia miltiorrhiza]|uniref:tryptophan aminotransferase-related protein 1-like n=1 Tax=Salvia miltiorrhiza TaxID=226208 RepID=UPI0025ABC59D|nr:tryptophan aminotransferase-related protein 1-like [Salvia miltiorrhiza]